MEKTRSWILSEPRSWCWSLHLIPIAGNFAANARREIHRLSWKETTAVPRSEGIKIYEDDCFSEVENHFPPKKKTFNLSLGRRESAGLQKKRACPQEPSASPWRAQTLEIPLFGAATWLRRARAQPCPLRRRLAECVRGGRGRRRRRVKRRLRQGD